MKKLFTLLFCMVLMQVGIGQDISLGNWQFRQAGIKKWYTATVPGTVHTDLLNNKLISDPFFAANEKELQWIDTVDWEYRCSFALEQKFKPENFYANILFDGLDTYADVYLNNKKILQANNMFRQWNVDIIKFLRPGKNTLSIYFHSAKKITAAFAKKDLPLVLPDDARVYARKAQYQFGWDWGPAFVGAGIWKGIELRIQEKRSSTKRTTSLRTSSNTVQFVQQPDSLGTSFYFTRNGQPFYAKGINWIPAHAFPTRVQKEDYRELLIMAKEAGMNMIRVWGGGYYESNDFYELCDSLGLLVWQDYMFACRMYPGDKEFFANVKEEVKQNVKRLSRYKCIVLWCGNNEVDEAWHHWGWQQQFNLHGADSAKLWSDYMRLFRDSLPAWTAQFDYRQRPYISTSPRYGWGNPLSYTHSDSHYWGLWWGLEPWEKFKTHTGRFVSEWGMQAMPTYSTVKKYTSPNDRTYNSQAVQWHQKASNGFMKLNHYINLYFFDTTQLSKLSLEEYGYLTQCLQYYIIKNSIATQMSHQPANMGTLIWQLNDCWPVTSWSLIDFFKQPKGGYYAAKKQFLSMDTTTDAVYPRQWQLLKPEIKITITNKGVTLLSNAAARYVYVDFGDLNKYMSDNFVNLESGRELFIPFRKNNIQWADKPYKIFTLYDILSK